MTPRGVPTQIPETVRAQMLEWADAGWSQARIAEGLNADGVATPRGASRWYSQSVRQVLVAERRRRAQSAEARGAEWGVSVRLLVELRCTDPAFGDELAQTVRVLAAKAEATYVRIVLNGVPCGKEGPSGDPNS